MQLVSKNYTFSSYSGQLLVGTPVTQTTTATPLTSFEHVTGQKAYELSNHLGNVLAVVSDARKPINGSGSMSATVISYSAMVVSATDYSAFGAPMPGRSYSSTNYRYGFNRQEKTDELHGNSGDAYDFGARMYDARLGRWFSRDAHATRYPDFTPYCFAGNNPIIYIDVDGNDIVFFNNDGVEVHRIESNAIFRTLVTVPNATSVSTDFAAVANNVQNEPAQTGWMEAPMPGVIQGFEDPVYQQNDHLIAAETATFNWKLINEPESLPTMSDKHHITESTNLPAPLDPTMVKAIEIQESGGIPRKGVYGGDVMLANYPGDWEATKDLKEHIGLSKGQAMDPRSSIQAGIKILYLRGMISDSQHNMQWRDASGGWETALLRYNGGGVSNYKASVLGRYAGAKVANASNYVDPSTTPAAGGGDAKKAGQN